MSHTTVLNKTVCLQLIVSLWSGRRRLRPEDLGTAANSLPPEELASLGSLKLCDPKRLAKLRKIGRAAERCCWRVCIGFLGGYATNEANVQHLIAQLESHKQRFAKEASAFANDFQDEVDSWIKRHPQWEDVIRRALPSAARIAGRLQFSFKVFRIAPATETISDPINSGLSEEIGGLTGQLFKEIAADARVAWQRSYTDKACVTQKALRPIMTIQRKLESLRYLDVRCQPIIDRITQVMGSLPKHGAIEKGHLAAVRKLLGLLQDTKAMREYGEAAMQDRHVKRGIQSDLVEAARDSVQQEQPVKGHQRTHDTGKSVKPLNGGSNVTPKSRNGDRDPFWI